MKILSLPAYFTPESVAGSHLGINRNEAFIKAGFEIVVHTPVPSRGLSDKVKNQYKKMRKEELYGGRMTIYRFPMFREPNNAILRSIRYLLCSIIQFLKGCTEKDYDLIFTSSTPPIQGAMASMVKKIRKKPFVYCLQDIFPDSLVSTGITKKGSLIWKAGRIVENFTYRNADRIIVISEDFKRNILQKNVPENKIAVIYNWVDEKVVVNVNRDENILVERFNLDRGKFYITYCGNIGLTQNIDMLIEVAKEIENIEDLCFILIGEGAYKNKATEMISINKIKNIKMIPFQPYKDISHVFSLGDVGLVISKPGVGVNSVPSKTWSIMSAGRPVLASFDENQLKEIIEKNNCGIFTRAGDKDAFINAIKYLFRNADKCREYGANGRKYILENLSLKKSVSEYVEIIKHFEKKDL